MWSWARDSSFRRMFGAITRGELAFFLVVILYGSFKDLFITRFSVGGSAFDHIELGGTILWSITVIVVLVRWWFCGDRWQCVRVSFVDLRLIDRWIYFLFIGITAGVIIFFSVEKELIPLMRSAARGTFGDVGPVGISMKACLEELEFRVVCYYTLERITGRTVAFWATLACFALIHANNTLHSAVIDGVSVTAVGMKNPYYAIGVIPAGIVFSVLTILTGSIVPAAVLHAAINLCAYVVFFSLA